MKYVDEYRDPELAGEVLRQIRQLATRQWVLMEVCGGQTHSLLRHGIEQELRGIVELIHGPGCPVCVTPAEAIDLAIALAGNPGITVASFGDMLRVPGTRDSLLTARAAGARVELVYSPLDAVQYAAAHPQQQVVFLAVGFETTVPATALAVLQAEQLGLTNFSLLAAHVRVQPAMEALLLDPDNRIQGFLAAGHVCAITGYAAYAALAERFAVPVVVTGFEPVDLLLGIRTCVQLLESGQPQAVNCYGRTVTSTGNQTAQALVDRVYEVTDQLWRGFGTIAQGGYQLRAAYGRFDAWRRFGGAQSSAAALQQLHPPQDVCCAADVLAGRLRPCDCPQFMTGCTPDRPLGAPMVSSEGACAAYARYVPLAGVQTEAR